MHNPNSVGREPPRLFVDWGGGNEGNIYILEQKKKKRKRKKRKEKKKKTKK